MPAIEHWLGFNILISVANVLFMAWLSVWGLKSMTSRLTHIVVSVLAIVIAIAVSFQFAKQEAERSKAEKDYVYFVPWRSVGSEIQFYRKATGALEKVRVWVMASSDNPNVDVPDYFNRGISHSYEVVDEGTHVAGLSLPSGDWTIDLDPKNPKGHVRQRIIVNLCDGEIAYATKVIRKANGEVLVDYPPPKNPLSEPYPLNSTTCQ